MRLGFSGLVLVAMLTACVPSSFIQPTPTPVVTLTRSEVQSWCSDGCARVTYAEVLDLQGKPQRNIVGVRVPQGYTATFRAKMRPGHIFAFCKAVDVSSLACSRVPQQEGTYEFSMTGDGAVKFE